MVTRCQTFVKYFQLCYTEVLHPGSFKHSKSNRLLTQQSFVCDASGITSDGFSTLLCIYSTNVGSTGHPLCARPSARPQ